MTVEGYETIILAGVMMLLVWYVSLPYDNVLFNAWDNTANQTPRNNHLQNPVHKTRTIVEQVNNLYNIDYIIEGIAKTIVYFVFPAMILYKMFITVKKELQFYLP